MRCPPFSTRSLVEPVTQDGSSGRALCSQTPSAHLDCVNPLANLNPALPVLPPPKPLPTHPQPSMHASFPNNVFFAASLTYKCRCTPAHLLEALPHVARHAELALQRLLIVRRQREEVHCSALGCCTQRRPARGVRVRRTACGKCGRCVEGTRPRTEQ